MFKNPIIAGFSPDPSICQYNGIYYLVTSTFEYFPGVTLYKSTNLTDWSYIGGILNRKDSLNLDKAACSSGLYAASIRVNQNGRFYMVTTNKFTHENFICHTDDIESNNWSDCSFISSDGIDPSLTFLSDGRCFYCSNGTIDNKKCIKGAFIDPDTGKLLEDFKILTTGTGGASTEGPHIYEIDNYFYLMFAEGGTSYGHYEAILRSKDIHGPYENNPNNPILSHVSRKGHTIQATGHADLIQGPDGSYYAVFLAIRVKPRPLLHHLGRETFLAPVYWKDSWPVIGNNGQVELKYDLLEQHIQSDYTFDFSKPLSSYPYLKVRVPKDSCYIQDCNKRTLTLIGEENINTHLGHPTLLGFRQRGLNEVMTAKIETKTLEGTAGISSFLSEDYHYRLEVKVASNNIIVSLIRHIHDFEAITEYITLELEDFISLKIESDSDFYYFYVNDKFLAKATVYALSGEGCMYNAFTGAIFAIYAQKGKAVFIDKVTMYNKEENL